MEEVYQDVTIEKISRADTNHKTGQKLFTKKGNPYHRVGLLLAGEEEWRNGVDFDNATEDWKKGDVVKVKRYEEEWNGKMYKKFDLPKKPNKFEVMEQSLNDLAARVHKLEQKINPTNDVKNDGSGGEATRDWPEMGEGEGEL